MILSRDVHPIILAGGLGSRLREVAPDTAKPMIRVHGRPFIAWVVRWLAQAGFTSATISICYLAEQFESYFKTDPIPGVKVNCVREPSPLGTAGAIQFVARQAGIDPSAWLVLNGDSLVLCDLKAMMQRYESGGMLVAAHVDDARRFGVLNISAEGRLLGFQEKDPARVGGGWINGGMYLLGAPLVREMSDRTPLSMEYDVLPGWLNRGEHLTTFETRAPFIDIGTRESLAAADLFIQQNLDCFI